MGTESQAAADGAAQTTEATGLLDQVIAATRPQSQKEADRARGYFKQFLEGAVKPGQVVSKDVEANIKYWIGEIDKKLTELKNQFFEGDDAKYQQELKNQGLSEADVKADLEAQLLSEKIFNQVTKGATVSDEQLKTYYDEHGSDYTTAEKRQVAHILVDSKSLADKIYAQLQDGADFAELAKKYSTDKASAKNGGELTDEKGSFVPEFEKVAFALDTGEIGEPVKSQYGWHVITALADTQPAAKQSFAEVKATIRGSLLSEQRNTKMTDWVNGVRAKYGPQVAYAVGFEPVGISTGAATTGP